MDRLPVSEALVSFLQTRVSAAATRTLLCELNQAPKPPTGQIAPALPYGIVYPIPGSQFTGTFAEPLVDAQLPFQVTSVGKSATQADWMADRVREALTTPPRPTLDNFKIIDVDLDGGPADIDAGGPDLFSVAERFILYATPA